MSHLAAEGRIGPCGELCWPSPLAGGGIQMSCLAAEGRIGPCGGLSPLWEGVYKCPASLQRVVGPCGELCWPSPLVGGGIQMSCLAAEGRIGPCGELCWPTPLWEGVYKCPASLQRVTGPCGELCWPSPLVGGGIQVSCLAAEGRGTMQ